MGTLTRLGLGATCFLTIVGPVAGTPSPGIVGFTFEKRRAGARDVHYLSRRQSKTVATSLDNEILLYFVNITVGTPPQPFSLELDTGSSDIWFPAANADICQQDVSNCPFGTYDASASSTYNDPNLPEFQTQSVNGTQITGAYLSDVLNIGGTQLTNMTMAATLEGNTRGIGIMGIGFQAGEVAASFNGFTYPSVISLLKNEGFINVLAYSLWLDALSANTGSILFGGVDIEKYHGDLVSLPIQQDSQTGTITSFTVAWTGLTVTGSGQISDFSPSTPQPAILDSGTSNTVLPDDIANSIFNGVGVSTDPSWGNVVRCSVAADDLTFAFQFGGEGGPLVNVSLSEYVTPLLTTDGSQPTFDNGDAACSFAIEAAGDGPILFGDSFLRSAYVVYDLENQQIGLAQTNFDSSTGKTNIQAFSVSGGIPNVVSTTSVASAAQTFTGIPLITEATASATSAIGSGTSRSATFYPNSTTATGGGGSGGNSTGTAHPVGPGVKIGIGVAVPVGVILIAIILAAFLMRRRRRMRRETRQNQRSRPDDGHAEEIQEGQEHLETTFGKPELEAAPVIDPTIRGPVKAKVELRSQGTMKAKAIDDPRATDAADSPNTNRPWSHEHQGYMPPELNSNPLSEAGSGSLTEQQIGQLIQQARVSKTSTSTSTAVPSSFDQPPLQAISVEASELAEEADVIVQELGLVNLRKKALTTQASAQGKRPEDVEGRKGEEFKELLERETRLKGRLDEIEYQRQAQ